MGDEFLSQDIDYLKNYILRCEDHGSEGVIVREEEQADETGIYAELQIRNACGCEWKIRIYREVI
jgi:hypothetical protein